MMIKNIPNLMLFVFIGAIVLLPVVSQAKEVNEQDEIILLNDSASALEDTNPELSRSLIKFADEKEKEWEYKNANKAAPPATVTDKNRNQIEGQIKILEASALAIQPTYPLIAQGLKKMVKEMNRSLEVEK